MIPSMKQGVGGRKCDRQLVLYGGLVHFEETLFRTSGSSKPLHPLEKDFEPSRFPFTDKPLHAYSAVFQKINASCQLSLLLPTEFERLLPTEFEPLNRNGSNPFSSG